ncbi:acid protease [Peniophora sp. CONT]|nr:acid protease [Peniophora sp. CONT]
MFPTTRLTAFLSLALIAAASPISTSTELRARLHLTKHINGQNLVASDRARIQSLVSRGRSTKGVTSAAAATNGSAGSAPITSQTVLYTASIGVGSQTFDVIVDTGSSNTWVGASTPYTPGDTSTNTGNAVVSTCRCRRGSSETDAGFQSVSYGSGSFSGTEYTDTVTLGSLTVTNQSIGVATQADFPQFDGILGIGPTDLTEGTVDGVDEVPTFTDNLFQEGTIPMNSVAVSFVPATSDSASANGELTFGGTDSTKFTGDITYTPITSTSPANQFWGIDQSIAYGNSSILSQNAGIVDTGTTLIYIATDAYTQYMSDTGATVDENTGLLTVTADQFKAMKSLFFTIGGGSFELTPNAQLWPRSLNSDIGGTEDGLYLIVNDIGTNSGEGLDFINGYAFLERFYSVFDTTNNQFGLATTQFTNATTN